MKTIKMLLIVMAATILFLRAAYGQLVSANGSGSASFEIVVYAPQDGVNYDVTAGTNDPNATALADYLESGFTARAYGTTHGAFSAGGGAFQISGDADGYWLSHADVNHTVSGYASAIVGEDLYLVFAHPTAFVADGKCDGVVTDAGGNGGAIASIRWDAGQTNTAGSANPTGIPIAGTFHVAGLTTSLALGVQAGGNAGAVDGTGSTGRGFGSGSITGGYDTNVVDPGSFKVVFTNHIGNLFGNCTAFAKYPPLVTYTGKTNPVDNIQSVTFNALPELPTTFGGPGVGHCTVVYKIGVTQGFDFPISYQMVARAPLFRVAGFGDTTVQVFYPSNWSQTCAYLTNISFDPPSGSAFPIGTNHCVAQWFSSTGDSGLCPFDVIVEPNGYALPGVVGHLYPADSDGDGVPDWQELVAGTDPFDPSDYLRFFPPVVSGTNVSLSWPTVAGIRYQVESGKLDGSAFVPIGSVIMGSDGLSSTNVVVPIAVTGETSRFYRLRVVLD